MAPETTATQVRLDIRGGIAWIVLDGKSTRNALDRDSAEQLASVCEQTDADPSVGAAVITGEHGAFCSGAAREALAGLRGAAPHSAFSGLAELYRGFERIRRLAVPTIAKVDGAAVGAGLNLALVADLRLATDRARFISGFAPNGLHPGGGHLHLLEQAISRQGAAALGVFACDLNAQEALERGLVWSVSTVADADAAIEKMTAPLARDPELARALKTSLNLTTAPAHQWLAATDIERARQMWSLSRPRPLTSA